MIVTHQRCIHSYIPTLLLLEQLPKKFSNCSSTKNVYQINNSHLLNKTTPLTKLTVCLALITTSASCSIVGSAYRCDKFDSQDLWRAKLIRLIILFHAKLYANNYLAVQIKLRYRELKASYRQAHRDWDAKNVLIFFFYFVAPVLQEIS